ncbi:hypothetical protein GCM10023336_21120 [Streptomyces similanensis]|uniref:DUF3558 domain-containing protein n=2 Tax=Streptomyces similanensis TaxID=1274988 RepID=A0ABP9K5V3_9ACTN
MNLSRTLAHRRSFLTVSGAIALLIALPGCGGSTQKREYTVPDSLCGTSVDAQALSAFLPSGKRLMTKATTTAQGFKCGVTVDGKLVVTTSQEWWNAMSVREFARGMTLDDPDHDTDDGVYAYSGHQAFGKADSCHSAKHKGQVLFTAIQATGSDHRDAGAMKRLITRYTQASTKTRCG